MRVAAQVFLAYALVLVLSSVWRFMPTGRATPDVVALMALYLGLTARQRLAPGVAGAVIIGYLADLLTGTPRGLMSLVAGLVCVAGHMIHRGLIVRGWKVTVSVSFFTGLVAGLIILAIRWSGGVSGGGHLGVLLASSALTAIFGPLVFRLCRLVDARFARTYRERDAALEGIAP